MLGRMHVAIASDRRALDLQKHDEQRSLPVGDLRERADFGIQIEARRLAAVESGPCLLALLAGQMQPIEHRLCSCNLVPRYDAIRLAERPHDGKRGFKKLRLHGRELLYEHALEQPARQVPKDETDEQPADAADHEPEEREYKSDGHGDDRNESG